MAGNTVNINLNVQDQNGSVKSRTDDVKRLNAELEKAQRLSTGTQAGARAYARAKPSGALEDTEYNRARGAMGATGASARDFANQAQGLGGLVRIYATVAANTFAAVSAFNALKNAADTTNMVQGLNQLGAASGIALGSLSLSLVKATDGAISLREAMEATAKGTAAGLSSKQMLELATSAKNASQALGISMNDAVSRLTRGITKLEPELLDELGLFTKVGKATEDYARSVGKSEASLSDFERRQAFANAVLKEARDKFGELNISANPYQQLEASIRNLTTAGLELINKFLGPLASILANNTALLGLVLAGIGAKLTRMAIPALAGWRDELVKAADMAKAKAQSINESFGEKFVERTTAAFKIPELKANLIKAETEFAKSRQKFLDIDNDYKQKSRAKVYQAVSAGEITPETITKMQREIAAKTREGTEASLRHADSLRALKEQYSNILAIRTKLTDAENKAQELADKPSWEEKQRMRISQRAGARAERLGVLSQVGADVQAGGLSYGLDMLRERVASAKDMSGWDKLRTKITGTFIAGATSAGILMQSLANIGSYVAVAVAAYSLLAMAFSKNSKEVGAFKDELEASNKVVENSVAVIKKYGDQATTEGIIARATSLGELSDKVDSLADKLQRADEKASWFDRLTDTQEFGIKSQFAEGASEAIAQQFSLIKAGPAKEALRAKVMEILGSASVNQKDLEKAIGGLANQTVVATTRKANEVIKGAVTQQKEMASIAQGVVDAIRTADTAAQNLMNTLISQDPLTKYGVEIANLGIELSKAFKNTDNLTAALKKLQDSKGFRLLDPEAFSQLKDLESAIPNLTGAITNWKNEISTLEGTATGLSAALGGMKGATEEQKAPIVAELERVQAKLKQLKINVEVGTKGVDALQEKLRGIVARSIETGFEMMRKQADYATKLGAVAFQKGILQGLSGPGMSKAQATLNIREIEIQKQQISEVQRLSEIMIQSNILREQANVLERASLVRKGAEAEKRDLTEEEKTTVADLMKQSGDFGAILTAIKARKTLSSQVIAGMSPEAMASARELEQTRRGASQKTEELNQKARLERAMGELGAQRELNAEKEKELQYENSMLGYLQQIDTLSLQHFEYLTEAQLLQKAEADSAKLQTDAMTRRVPIENEISLLKQVQEKADSEMKVYIQQLIDSKNTQLKQLNDQTAAEKRILEIQQAQAKITAEFVKANIERERAFQLTQQDQSLSEARLRSEQELFQIRQQLGLVLLPQEIADNEKIFKQRESALQADKERAAAEKRRADELAKYEEKIRQAKAADKDADVSSLLEGQKFAQQVYTNEIKLIELTTAARQKAIDLQYSMTERQKSYADIFKNTFEGMADAIVDFVQTGKLNFKSLIDSMLADILRYELRLQALALWAAARPAIMSFLGNLIPGFGGTTAAPVLDSTATMAATTAFGAKGAYFDGSSANFATHKFARGGMFTNSIVDSPTLFKFAKGTGMMGEAGPEAIMPLQRDSSGNLGVRAQGGGGKTEVVVNNYSGERAEARETVDSRGNRRIEVIVGDMAAGEVSRSGSTAQRSIRNTFGLSPQLIRR